MPLDVLNQLQHIMEEHGFRADTGGRTPAFYPLTDTPQVGKDTLTHLHQYLLDTDTHSVRLCLHDSPGADVHVMIIVQRPGGDFPIHKHLDKAESYVIQQGELMIRFMDDSGDCCEEVRLGDGANITNLRVPAGRWHQVLPLSSPTVFQETRPGPFEGGDSVLWEQRDD